MDRHQLQDAIRATESEPQGSACSSAAVSAHRWTDPDVERRVLMWTRLFAVFPSSDLDMSMETYDSLTLDIPWRVISHALGRLCDQPVMDRGQPVARRFAPSVAEIRRTSAMLIARQIRKAEGRDPDGYSPHGTGEMTETNVQRWIERAPQVLELLPALGTGRPRSGGELGPGRS